MYKYCYVFKYLCIVIIGMYKDFYTLSVMHCYVLYVAICMRIFCYLLLCTIIVMYGYVLLVALFVYRDTSLLLVYL